jgi:hypothetical protein
MRSWMLSGFKVRKNVEERLVLRVRLRERYN